ncbi:MULTISPECIES: hypothetical protein [Roseobacteraceae]|jgi:hypothetical protein|uniref:Uncharacterized protein n=1 Tax=Pseudosulfitobacter pseudonitzschiae TaxID=1402135 RepID=A0A221K319_9RHOB|nr:MULTISPECIES: hypothetical protein [Roseobacteraceae]ASM73270.1 hypothetical protein SULPSESMR1_02473 [Pseudosulfitobacter pseudonitzschiae]
MINTPTAHRPVFEGEDSFAGLGLQLTFWPTGMIDRLTAKGFGVVVFGDCDIGRSSRVATPPPSMLRARLHEDYDLAAGVIQLIVGSVADPSQRARYG